MCYTVLKEFDKQIIWVAAKYYIKIEHSKGQSRKKWGHKNLFPQFIQLCTQIHNVSSQFLSIC